ncbi:hypothetical protein N7527_006374 [Penicillium freii]|uniref:Uncharacterized protein n=1 Tax=Penicillium freii TaxID=48697 RepID=A0A101MLB8_PENFR|nr:hypothetical protein N7527_006374 [Penicillium freii]KUM62653.1 hypothetical protein ACN42_g4424 [Penicillium freii]
MPGNNIINDLMRRPSAWRMTRETRTATGEVQDVEIIQEGRAYSPPEPVMPPEPVAQRVTQRTMNTRSPDTEPVAQRVTQRTMNTRSPDTAPLRRSKRSKPTPQPIPEQTGDKRNSQTIIQDVRRRIATINKLITDENDTRREHGLTERPIWAPGDPDPANPPPNNTSKARACAPLATVVQWDNENNWIPPPAGVKLSDELAYIAAKSTMSNRTLNRMYPFDFDGNGTIKATRTPEDPAPLIRAHGLPLIAVARDTVALTGRQHALLGAALYDKNDKNVKAARSAFSIGALVAPQSFVQMPRTIDRQLFTHAGTYLDAQKTESALAKANFPKEFKPACNARDTMSSLHNAPAVLMGDPLAVVRLIDLPGYRLACGPAQGSTTISENFVTKFASQPYANMLANDYINTDDVRAPVTIEHVGDTDIGTGPTPRMERVQAQNDSQPARMEHRTDSQPARTEHRIDPLLRLKAAGVREVADDNIRSLLDRIEDIPNVIQSLRQRAETDDTDAVREVVRRHQAFRQDLDNTRTATDQLAADISTANPLFQQFLMNYLTNAKGNELV